ncbi:MAG: hypothetical protein COA43_03630 [Robiginitomaculum sp.]|nr:MAG: hypothetical protein COA43_03630 [Robiginitomaculum sp.]
MVWNRNRAVALNDDLDILLGDLFNEWGLENLPDGEAMLKKYLPLRSLDFTNEIVVCAGMKVEDETNLARRIKRKFVQRYGQTVSTASYGREY